MKAIKLLISFLFITAYSIGQDNTFTDYKDEKESFSHLKDKTIRREVASFTEAGADENNPKIKLEKLPLTKFGTNFSTFEKDSIFVKFTIGKFIKANHKIKYADHFAVKIDNKPIWGTDGEIPKEQINSIEVRIGKDTIIIPKSAFVDLYEPSLSSKESDKTVGRLWVYYSKDKKRFYIAMSNSDGAGYYEAALIIKDKKYYGRVVDYGF